jgi:serine/threonine protein kinase
MQLSPAMRFGKHSSGTSVIVKHLRSRCDELSILQHLSSIKSSENHTIPLLKSFSLDVGTFIVVPEYNPLELGLRFGDLGGKTVNLSNQLIEGVAFIHRNGVAHLDIKPRNILVRSQDDRLYIIDFDISVRVDGPNHFTDIWCGTVGWMAPEIGGPNRLYSPIRADLWSCGRVIRYLIGYNSSKEAEELKALSRRLLDPNPLMRPLLHLPASGVHRPPKRKANALENP